MADAPKLPPPKLTPHELRRAAVIAGLDPRTVAARIDGRRMRSTTAARADEGLRAIGFDVSTLADQAA